MARRSDHTREELLALVIQEGSGLLAEEGLSGFGARKLSRRIGYTVGTLYHLFGDYDTLLLHLHAATLDDLHAKLEMVPLTGKPEKRLEKLAMAYLAFARKYYFRWSALFEHHLPEDRALPEWYEEKLGSLFALVEQPLREYSGATARKSAKEARVLWAAVHGVCALGLSGKLAVVGTQSSEESMLEVLLMRYLADMRG